MKAVMLIKAFWRFYALALGMARRRRVPEQGGGMSVANHGHSDPSPAAAWQAERGERPASASITIELWSFYKCGYFISTQTGYTTPSKV